MTTEAMAASIRLMGRQGQTDKECRLSFSLEEGERTVAVPGGGRSATVWASHEHQTLVDAILGVISDDEHIAKAQLTALVKAGNALRPHAMELEGGGTLTRAATEARTAAATYIRGVANWAGLRSDPKRLERDLQLNDIDAILLHKSLSKWDPRNSGTARKEAPSQARIQDLLGKAIDLVATSRRLGTFDGVGAALELCELANPLDLGPATEPVMAAHVMIRRIMGAAAVDIALAHTAGGLGESMDDLHTNLARCLQKPFENTTVWRKLMEEPFFLAGEGLLAHARKAVQSIVHTGLRMYMEALYDEGQPVLELPATDWTMAMKDTSLSEQKQDPWEKQAKHLRNNVKEANQMRVIPQEIAATIDKYGLPALHDIYQTMQNECSYTLKEFLQLEVDENTGGEHRRVTLAELAVRDMLFVHGASKVLDWLKACKGSSGAATATAAERTAGRRTMAYEVITMAKRLVMNTGQTVTHNGNDVTGKVIELEKEGGSDSDNDSTVAEFLQHFHTMPLPGENEEDVDDEEYKTEEEDDDEGSQVSLESLIEFGDHAVTSATTNQIDSKRERTVPVGGETGGTGGQHAGDVPASQIAHTSKLVNAQVAEEAKVAETKAKAAEARDAAIRSGEAAAKAETLLAHYTANEQMVQTAQAAKEKAATEAEVKTRAEDAEKAKAAAEAETAAEATTAAEAAVAETNAAGHRALSQTAAEFVPMAIVEEAAATAAARMKATTAAAAAAAEAAAKTEAAAATKEAAAAAEAKKKATAAAAVETARVNEEAATKAKAAEATATREAATAAAVKAR
jgi:hypothetical protein